MLTLRVVLDKPLPLLSRYVRGGPSYKVNSTADVN